MNRLGIFALFFFLLIGNRATAVKLVYGEYKIFFINKKFKKDSTNFLRVNVHYDGIRIARATLGAKAGKCEMFTDRGKLLWENTYTNEKRVFKQYYPDKKLECYSVFTNDYDSVMCYYPSGKVKYAEIKSAANLSKNYYSEAGEPIQAPVDTSKINQLEEQYRHTGLITEDHQRKIVFRSATRFIYVRTSDVTDFLHIQIFDTYLKDRYGLVYEKEYHPNGIQKSIYSITGRSEMRLVYNEKGQNIERLWRMLK